jgi:hypothetical protein
LVGRQTERGNISLGSGPALSLFGRMMVSRGFAAGYFVGHGLFTAQTLYHIHMLLNRMVNRTLATTVVPVLPQRRRKIF